MMSTLMMPTLTLLQSVAPHSPEMITAGVVGLIVGAGKVWDHVKGRKRDQHQTVSLSRISVQINEVRDDVRDLSAHVIGPDGKNGLRSDVRKLEGRVDGLEERERDRLHSPYDRRS